MLNLATQVGVRGALHRAKELKLLHTAGKKKTRALGRLGNQGSGRQKRLENKGAGLEGAGRAYS